MLAGAAADPSLSDTLPYDPKEALQAFQPVEVVDLEESPEKEKAHVETDQEPPQDRVDPAKRSPEKVNGVVDGDGEGARGDDLPSEAIDSKAEDPFDVLNYKGVPTRVQQQTAKSEMQSQTGPGRPKKARGSEAGPKAKAKAKAKALAKAKAKAKARSSKKPAAKAKAKAEKEMEEVEGEAKPQPKAKAKGKRNQPKEESKSTSQEADESGESPKRVKTDPPATGANCPAQGVETPDRNPAPGPVESGGKVVKEKSFARRVRPQDPEKSTRWEAIRDTFNDSLKAHLPKPLTTHEAGFQLYH